MVKRLIPIFALLSLMLAISPAWADEYQDTINVFRNAGRERQLFQARHTDTPFFRRSERAASASAARLARAAFTKKESTSATHRCRKSPSASSSAVRPTARSSFSRTSAHSRNLRAVTLSSARKLPRSPLPPLPARRRDTTGSSAGVSGGKHDAKTVGAIPQRHGDVHRGQGRADVRSEHRRPEVQLQAALIVR